MVMSSSVVQYSSVIRLPLRFSVEGLQKDLKLFSEEDWISHWNTKAYEGDWKVLPLYAVGGHKSVIYSPPVPGSPYAPTEHLERATEYARVLEQFSCEFTSVRLMRLDTGAVIKDHTDQDLSVEDGEVRLHIPVQTSPEVEFIIDEIRAPMAEGELWYGNFTKTHRLSNSGSSPRIHLVIDCKLNDWILNLLNQGTPIF